MGKDILKTALPIYLSAEQVNGLLAALDLVIEVDSQNLLAKSAKKLKDKILKHSRKFQTNGENCASIYFFPSEIVPLFRILVLLVSIGTTAKIDYYSMIGQTKD